MRSLLRRSSSPSSALPATPEAALTQADRLLAERLCATFEHDLTLLPIEGIHFYIKEGTVTLHGTVRHALDHELLVSLVQDVQGVRDVVSHLDVQAALTTG